MSKPTEEKEPEPKPDRGYFVKYRNPAQDPVVKALNAALEAQHAKGLSLMGTPLDELAGPKTSGSSTEEPK